MSTEDLMEGVVDHKVPGGKMLRVRVIVREEGGKRIIKELRITGDFFLHPESTIEEIEGALTGESRTEEEMLSVITEFLKGDVILFGASAFDIARVVFEAVSRAK